MPRTKTLQNRTKQTMDVSQLYIRAQCMHILDELRKAYEPYIEVLRSWVFSQEEHTTHLVTCVALYDMYATRAAFEARHGCWQTALRCLDRLKTTGKQLKSLFGAILKRLPIHRGPVLYFSPRHGKVPSVVTLNADTAQTHRPSRDSREDPQKLTACSLGW